MFKILCIDDEPDAPKIANKTLKQILHDIYDTSSYEVIFATNGDKGIEIAGSDKDIKLVLLDVEFKKQKKQGDMIAEDPTGTQGDSFNQVYGNRQENKLWP
jgi:CheY-like chemotaxis protein